MPEDLVRAANLLYRKSCVSLESLQELLQAYKLFSLSLRRAHD